MQVVKFVAFSGEGLVAIYLQVGDVGGRMRFHISFYNPVLFLKAYTVLIVNDTQCIIIANASFFVFTDSNISYFQTYIQIYFRRR